MVICKFNEVDVVIGAGKKGVVCVCVGGDEGLASLAKPIDSKIHSMKWMRIKSRTTIFAVTRVCMPMMDTSNSTCTLSVVEHDRNSTVKLAIVNHEHCHSSVKIRDDMQKFQEAKVKVLVKGSQKTLPNVIIIVHGTISLYVTHSPLSSLHMSFGYPFSTTSLAIDH